MAVQASKPVSARPDGPVRSEAEQARVSRPTPLLTPASTTEARRLVSPAPPAGPGLVAPWASWCGLRRVNPMCWGIRDLSELTLDDAIRSAKAAKEDKFIWGGVRYIVKNEVRNSGMTLEEQLSRNGITDEQYNRAYVAGLSERFYDRVTPDSYGHLGAAIHAYQNHDDGARNQLFQGKWRTARWANVSPNARLDSWALYLGLPQRYGTFRISRDKPAGAPQSAGEYLSFTDPAMDDKLVAYALRKLPDEVDDRQSTQVRSSESQQSSMTVADDIDSGPQWFQGNKTMGHFQLERHRDERGHYIAYAYTWKLNPIDGLPVIGAILRVLSVPTPEASEVACVGHPFAIYGRVYYDPSTGMRLDPQP